MKKDRCDELVPTSRLWRFLLPLRCTLKRGHLEPAHEWVWVNPLYADEDAR